MEQTTVTTSKASDPSTNPADWSAFYADLQKKGNVPDASATVIDRNRAIFRDMYQDLSVIKEALRNAAFTPAMVTIYADVLTVPEGTNWLLASEALVIFARRIEVAGDATVLLDYRQTGTARLVVFASEMTGTLSAKAVIDSDAQPTLFAITQENVSPGISIAKEGDSAIEQELGLKQGMGFSIPEDMQLYLNNSFIFGSLLYDQNQTLAISLFLWTKGWAAQSDQFEELFYRSTTLATLLSSEVNAAANGAKFVPYLTASIYTDLATAFAADAAKYESDYMELSTQKVLTEEGIALAKTMVANAQSEVAYVNALLQQATENDNAAEATAAAAQYSFTQQQIAVDGVAAKFEQIGIPDYRREQTIKAVVTLVEGVVTFCGAIALMALGDEAAAPAAAGAAADSAEAVAGAAETGVETAKLAASLASTMKDLKKLVEVLQKVYELAKVVNQVASDISSAGSQMDTIQQMDDITDGTDLSAASSWAVFKIQADNALQDPIDLGIEYAKEYKEAVDILVVYGQSLSAAQLAVIKASQETAAIIFQLHYAQEKQDNLQKLVDDLNAGQAPILLMMQQFYQKYLDAKSSLFAALKSYQDSYFYWALRESSVQPGIVDPVEDLDAGIRDITKLAMDEANALEQFNPPPQKMQNILFEVTDPATLEQLRTTGKATWILPLDNQAFAHLQRVRLSNLRVWLEGVGKEGDSVFMTINTAGNYLDRYRGTNYQFNSQKLIRTFEYRVAAQGINPDWRFADGSFGFVQVDGAVDEEVAYAYFEPTPFSEWSISLGSDASEPDYSGVSKISMSFQGTAIGSVQGEKSHA